MQNPFKIVEDFESALCEYTGAKYAVTTTSCTMALLLACRWHYVDRWNHLIEISRSTDVQLYPIPTITIPNRTYVGVPMSIIHAGFNVAFEDVDWEGHYTLMGTSILDSARWFTAEMAAYDSNQEEFICVSFHPTKHLGISTHGGAILHNNEEADEWFRMMRFDGRKQGVAPRNQKEWVLGYHCYMNPVMASEGLLRLSTLPQYNEPLPNDPYPDLSKMSIFR